MMVSLSTGEPRMTETKRLKSKICLVGNKSVGKTSLIRRYVLNMFDDHYLMTIGTKVSKKQVRVLQPEHDRVVDIDMAIWDIMGTKEFQELLRDAYFYGANGILAVCDLVRRRTLDDLDEWIDGVDRVVGKVPVLIAVNKSDLISDAQFADREVAQVAKAFGSEFLRTSAKTGEHVEEAFHRLGALVAEDQFSRE